MKKDRLVGFKKRLLDKQYQLVQEVGRTALYGKDQEDDSIKDLGDQANTAYTREFFFELGNGDRRLLREVVMALQKIEDGSIFCSAITDRKSTRLNSSHITISYAVFCLKKKKTYVSTYLYFFK